MLLLQSIPGSCPPPKKRSRGLELSISQGHGQEFHLLNSHHCHRMSLGGYLKSKGRTFIYKYNLHLLHYNYRLHYDEINNP